MYKLWPVIWETDREGINRKKFSILKSQRTYFGTTINSVQFSCSVLSDSLWSHESQHARPPCPSPTPGVHSDSQKSIKSLMPSSHLILCRPLLLLPPIPPSIRVFSNESTLHMRWPKYWSFSFSNIPSKEHPGLISFRMNWLDLLAASAEAKISCGNSSNLGRWTRSYEECS